MEIDQCAENRMGLTATEQSIWGGGKGLEPDCGDGSTSVHTIVEWYSSTPTFNGV